MSSKDMIITLPDPRLREKSKRIKLVSEQAKKIIKQMKAATLDWEASREHEVGVALAAVQIGEMERIIIVRDDFDNKDNHSFSVFINPEVITLEGEVVEDYEGCLSVKDIYGMVPRHSKVRLKALDENGQEVRVRVEGFLARVFQHEIDHTNGIVFVDHIEDKKDGFYRITDEGKLEGIDYEQVKAADILRK